LKSVFNRLNLGEVGWDEGKEQKKTEIKKQTTIRGKEMYFHYGWWKARGARPPPTPRIGAERGRR